MTSGQSTYLVDTNVLIYSVDRQAGPKRERAQELLRLLAQRRAGYLSVQVLGEFFNTATRTVRPLAGPLDAAGTAEALAAQFPVLALTVEAVLRAVRQADSHEMSYWDALIWATAKLNGIATVLTEDIQSSAAIEGVTFLNPFAPGFDLTSL